MKKARICTAAEMAEHIQDGATVLLSGSGGGLQEADHLAQAIEQRFLQTGHPAALTLVHALGIGDGQQSGVTRFAHEGMVRRVIGGHWTWSRPMQELARRNCIEAYTFPAGVIQTLVREAGAGRHGLVTHIGLDTFADPRHGGGKCNQKAQEDLVEVITLGGRELLWYKPLKIDVALVRGTFADPQGNVSAREEPADMDAYAAALAGHNCGGKVFAQVRTLLDAPISPARDVLVPGVLVDAVCVFAAQCQTTGAPYDLALSGQIPRPVGLEPLELPQDIRLVIARRAAQELAPDCCVNFGFGLPDGVPAAARSMGKDISWTVIEQGPHNGQLLGGALFGATKYPSAIVTSNDQFDFFSGGGVDIAFLGMGELDAEGNVNASWLGESIVGPGGFVDITQCAKKVVFCGTFEAKGLSIRTDGERVEIASYGQIAKLVPQVKHITFSGRRARQDGQQVVYVTERAVFALTAQGLMLQQIAPGIDLHRDVLDRMPFKVLLSEKLQALT
jgi:acyl CoA:acetate/3-ketoacid CoA transferase